MASNAQKVIATGAQQRNSKPREQELETQPNHSKSNENPSKRKSVRTACSEDQRCDAVKTTSPNAALAGVGDPSFRRKASPAQIARTRWKNGSQRKLQRNMPAVGVIQSKSTSNSSTSSHLICLTISRGRQSNPAISAAGATKPQANSAPAVGGRREEKSVQFTSPRWQN